MRPHAGVLNMALIGAGNWTRTRSRRWSAHRGLYRKAAEPQSHKEEVGGWEKVLRFLCDFAPPRLCVSHAEPARTLALSRRSRAKSARSWSAVVLYRFAWGRGFGVRQRLGAAAAVLLTPGFSQGVSRATKASQRF